MAIISTRLLSLPMFYNALVIQEKWRLMTTISLLVLCFVFFFTLSVYSVPFCLKMLFCKNMTYASAVLFIGPNPMLMNISVVLLT